jgi:hypothetical protein
MKNKKILIISVFFVIILFVTGYIYFNSTGKIIQDDALYKWVSSEKNFVYYKNDSTILPTSEDTERAHDNFQRTRLNKIAATMLNAEGKLPKGAVFPDSSIIVKEIYSDKNSKPEILAVMVKLKGAENSNKDWLWAEYSPSGDVEYSVSRNGKVCVGCHKPGDDYVRIFDIIK